jgi:hypothetical protein
MRPYVKLIPGKLFLVLKKLNTRSLTGHMIYFNNGPRIVRLGVL